ncbi:unnamed protein product [Camellia sinensis]
MAFARRTLARCRAFEDSGTSCFNEPSLKDALFAAPCQGNKAEPSTCLGVGSFHSSAEQHDLHRGSLDAFDNFPPSQRTMLLQILSHREPTMTNQKPSFLL